MTTKLQNRAAAALDATHDPRLAYRGPVTMKVRAYLAAWLDGQKIRTITVRKSVEHLEMIARTA